MAHERARHAEALLKKLLAFSPVVGVFGHRQVGKTTLVTRHCKEYVTLDIQSQLNRVEADPETFISGFSGHPLGIDEAQYAPTLFPVLKELVRKNKRPGQFLLSGSVRFTSRKAIRESLTGRIVHLELLPFTQREMDGKSLSKSVFSALKGNWDFLTSESQDGLSTVRRYLETGGLPGVCFIRSPSLRAQRLESQLETILERDLRLVLATRLPYSTLRNVLVNLALIQGEPLDLSALARKTRVSIPTLRNLLRAFESIFLIRTLPTEGTERHPVIFLEDQGEASHLASRPQDPLSDLTRFLFAQVRSPLRLADTKSIGEIFQYRTRGGAHVPLGLRLGAQILGMIPILNPNPGRQPVSSATSFLRHYPGSRILFVHSGKKSQVLSNDMAVASVTAFV
jgi:predicted AAA+ superfamily ATPase